jgi:DNA-binding beta-propeller fold protein YncE
MPAAADAAPAPKTLWNACTTGSGAGQCVIPRGIAADPSSGHLFVADQGNGRVAELTAWGEFVKAWGWGVIDGAEELQTCTPVSGCREGSLGSGAGQFGKFGPQGVTVDAAGDVYVVDYSNNRVQKFDPTAGPSEEAKLLLTFGSSGTGDGEFAWGLNNFSLGSFIAAGPGNTIYVGDEGRVQKFDSAGNYLESIPLPGEIVQSLAVDPVGDIYLALFKDESEDSGSPKEDVAKLDPTGKELCRAKVKNPRAIASDAIGNLYVADGRKAVAPVEMQVRKFGPNCKEVEDAQFPFADGFDYSSGIATNTVTAAGGVGLYIANVNSTNSYVRAYYPPPDKWPAPPAPPAVLDQFATSADTDSAIVRAKIDPRFWADTRYYVQYGPGECSSGGCWSQPLPPGTPLGGGIVGEGISTAPVVLSGLAPNTTYHYRFVAQSSGGGPAFGSEASFTTLPPEQQPLTSCPNQALRIGAGAKLSECRAYELVSPLDKENGDIEVLDGNYRAGYRNSVFARIVQATPGGEKLTYSATRAFANPESAPWSSQYLAARNPVTGWSSRSISPPRSNLLFNENNTEVPFKSFSENLCSGWVLQDTDLTLNSQAPPGVPNLYRRDYCGAEDYEVLSSVPPPGFSAETEPLKSKYYPEIQGFTADGAHSFMRANAKLTEDASSKDLFQLYETSEGSGGAARLRLISVLPSGKAAAAHASLGTTAEATGEFRNDSIAGAVSTDGSRVFWTASTVEASEVPTKSSGTSERPEPGTIYLRANPLAEQSSNGKCIEAAKACTLAISVANSEFWAADPAGSLVIYQTGDRLFEARIEDSGESLSVKSTLIAEGVAGVMGTSEDATKIYFVSTKALASGAVAGEPNLYLREHGVGVKLVATLGDLDSDHFASPSPVNIKPNFRTSRVSADGQHAVFMSHASPTDYDNTDASSAQPDAEVFLYDAEAGEGAGDLVCVSCNPTGARPAGRKIGAKNEEKTEIWFAAQIPGWEYQHHASRVLAEDGSRLFFESYDSLVPSDTNGARDVYEWQRASGEQACAAIGAALYSRDSGGCLSLISSGKSPQDSEFIDASTDGRDVFFTTRESLFSEDPGLIDVYDARIGGGFAAKIRASSCQGEACQRPATAPNDPTPASAAFRGPGDRRQGKPRCRKGQRKMRRAGKARCVQTKKSKRSTHAR